MFGTPKNYYLNQEAVPYSNFHHINFYVQLKIIDLAQKGGAQAPFALPLPTGLELDRLHEQLSLLTKVLHVQCSSTIGQPYA